MEQFSGQRKGGTGPQRTPGRINVVAGSRALRRSGPNPPSRTVYDRESQMLPGVTIQPEVPMRFEKFSFGSIRIDGTTYEHDVVIDRGDIRKRKKKLSKKFRDAFGHTPLSIEEDIPWKCRQLVIGTGTGALPVMKEVTREAKRRKIKLLVLPTAQAIKTLKQNPNETNAILHVTC